MTRYNKLKEAHAIMDLLDNARGDYRFLTGIPPYSSGVIPMDGHEVVHFTLQKPLTAR
jgi:hypothetical protein